MTVRLSEAVGVALCVFALVPTSVIADESPLQFQEADYQTPFIYSLTLMSIGLPMLIETGAFHESPSLNNFTDAFDSPPRWDNDSATFNFVLHPLWGSETYLRAREANWGLPKSIAFSMGMSVTWEYFMESWVEHPSTQDLIFTTGIGWVIGELRYKLKQRTDENWHWPIDPIYTTLKHLKIAFVRDRKGETVTMLSTSWHF